MNRYTGILLILTVSGCNPTTTDAPQAEQIVKRSVEHHGGLTNWEKLNSISYTKNTTLFDSSGSVESSASQQHAFRLKPELEGTIKWFEKEDSIKIVYSRGKGMRYVNNVPDSSSQEASKNNVLAALYVLFQPFKLMDEGIQLVCIRLDTLDGLVVDIVRAKYEGATAEDDQWLFYFDNKNDELIANVVNHNGRYSYIKNLEFDTTSPMKLHQHRKSYFVDSLLTIKYLRAEYFYTNYRLTFQ